MEVNIEVLDKGRQLIYNTCRAKPISYFIENYCFIEDRDAEEIYIPFKLWEKQKEVLRSIDKNRLNILLKARQLGMSWLCLAYALRGMLFKGGYSVIALSRSEEEAKELIRRMLVMLKHMPQLIRHVKDSNGWFGPTYEETVLTITIRHPNMAESTMKALTSGQHSGVGFTASLLILDEWAKQQYARDIWRVTFPIVNRPRGGKVIGISTMERGTLFEDIIRDENSNFNKIFLPWYTDPERTQEWYEATRRELGDLIMQEYPATVEEALTIPGGAFFPELSTNIHVCEISIDDSWRRYVALDYGLDRLVCLWVGVSESGHEHIYREYCESNLIPSEAAQKIIEITGEEVVYQYFAPPDLWNRNRDTGKSTAEIFAESKIYLSKVSNDRVQGWLHLKEHLKVIERVDDNGIRFKDSFLTMSSGCRELWDCMCKIQKDKHNPNDASRNQHHLTHAPDALRYFCSGRPTPKDPVEPVKRKRLIDLLLPKNKKTMWDF